MFLDMLCENDFGIIYVFGHVMWNDFGIIFVFGHVMWKMILSKNTKKDI